MPAVFVHGVPETPAVWDALRGNLSRDDVVALQLPGFGCPRPGGLRRDEGGVRRVARRRARADQRAGPDRPRRPRLGRRFRVAPREHARRSRALVGDRHRRTRPCRLRVARRREGVADAGRGRGVLRTDTSRRRRRSGARLYAAVFGVPLDAAIALNRPIDQTMADCILDLYRSAIDVGREWAPDFHDIPAPGCVLLARRRPAALRRPRPARRCARGRHADRAQRRQPLVDAPGSRAGAAALEEFWSTLG